MTAVGYGQDELLCKELFPSTLLGGLGQLCGLTMGSKAKVGLGLQCGGPGGAVQED